MTIDRDLYQKYSGRTGDPHTRLGESLAQRDAQRARREEARDALEGDGEGPSILLSDDSQRTMLIILILVGIVAAAVALVRFLG